MKWHYELFNEDFEVVVKLMGYEILFYNSRAYVRNDIKSFSVYRYRFNDLYTIDCFDGEYFKLVEEEMSIEECRNKLIDLL